MQPDASPARAQVLLAAVCFGTSGTAQALGPGGAPTSVGAVRIVVGALLLWLIARALGGSGGMAPTGLAWLAGVGVAAYQLAFFAAVDQTGVAVGTVVAIGSGPAAAGLLSRIVNGEPLTARWAAATGLACAGIVLLGAGGGSASVDPAGVALAVAAGLGYASYTVLAKRMIDRGAAPERVMSAAFGRGAILLLPVPLVAGLGWLGSPEGVALALYLGAVPTALAYLLFARGLRRLSAGETATLTLAEPLTAVMLGALVLGERPGTVAIAGAGLVLAGLLVLAAPRGRPTPRPALAAEAQG
ncbi:MAG TPA: EamA family transporter [Thermoleophilaceae bacterium]|nr:EamA family transporter [Thermoleophilaceae bacterium]